MDDLYDEFGNFIGEAEDSEAGDQVQETYGYEEDAEPEANEEKVDDMEVEEGLSNAVILHEDKQYYPSAQQVYGEDVETMVQDEDAQPLSQPIIAPIKQKKFIVQEEDLPATFFDRSFMTDLMNFPEQVRNIALCGHLHHGKTAFMDMLVLQTHDISANREKLSEKVRDKQMRYTDTHTLERERGVSIKASPMSLVLPNAKGKSHLINIIDTPGHVNFADEIAASIRIADGVVLVVDAVEGVQVTTEHIIKHAVLDDLPLTLVINKMDRLIVELRIPPADAYFKLKHIVEEVNTIIERTIPGRGEARRVSPEKGNVAFACSSMDWVFTLSSFAKMYADSYPGVNIEEFARRLWGDIFFNPDSRKFTRKGVEGGKRSFVSFVMEPIYKLYSHTISENPQELKKTLASLGISLKPTQLKTSAKELLRLVCHQFFGGAEGFVDMVLEHVPSPVEGADRMVDKFFTGPTDSDMAKAVRLCDQDGPLVVHITKLFSTPDATEFYSFGRVLSGTARSGQRVRVLGEGYTVEDEEDMAEVNINDTFISESKYNVPTSGVPAGNWVLLSGVDHPIVKTATIIDPTDAIQSDAYIFRPLKHFFESVFKVAVEPISPSELPKMLDGMRKVSKSYPLVTTKVEESGEHVILGTGELYMDCVLHDLRTLYSEMQIKVSDPVTRFCETCYEQSAMHSYATTPNQKNRITMVAEPLDDGIAEDIESGRVNIKDPARVVGKFFESNYGYDILASRNIWAFGPDDQGPNILQNDTLPEDVDPKLLRTVRESLRQGFSWATREGPLCEEPIRNTKFKVADITLANEAIARGGGQIIPTARRACWSSFILASPRLMEPVYSVDMLGPQEAIESLHTVLRNRRGHVLADNPVPGTPLYRANGLIPVIDSFGFETDLRIKTLGRATVSLVFDRWQVVPGDPLDQTVNSRKLEPASAMELARDFVSKTRRRKGLKDDLGMARFHEADIVAKLRENGMLT